MKRLKAGTFAAEKHEGQYRADGVTPYIEHPRKVARLVVYAGGSNEVIAAALLHDVVEDCGVRFVEIEGLCGREVAQYVKDATEPPDKKKLGGDWVVLKAPSMTPGGALVKIADQIANESDLPKSGWTEEKKEANREKIKNRVKALQGVAGITDETIAVMRAEARKG